MQPIFLVEAYAAEEFNIQASLLDLLEGAIAQLPVPDAIKAKARDLNNELLARKAAREHRMGVQRTSWPFGIKGLVDWFEAATKIPSPEVQASIVASHLCRTSPNSGNFVEDYKAQFSLLYGSPNLHEQYIGVIKSDIVDVGKKLNEHHGLNVTWEVNVERYDPESLAITFHPKELGKINFIRDGESNMVRASTDDMLTATGKTRIEAMLKLLEQREKRLKLSL